MEMLRVHVRVRMRVYMQTSGPPRLSEFPSVPASPERVSAGFTADLAAYRKLIEAAR